MIGRSYVLVANRSEAKIFALRNHGRELELCETWANRFGHNKDQDIYTDRPGRQSSPASQVPGVDSMPRKDAAEHEAERFAGDIVAWLDNKRKTDKVYQLDIVAEPSFLGKLRNKMDKPLQELVSRVVDKDVIDASEERLLAYIKH